MAKLKTTIEAAERMILLGLASYAKDERCKTVWDRALNFEAGTLTCV